MIKNNSNYAKIDTEVRMSSTGMRFFCDMNLPTSYPQIIHFTHRIVHNSSVDNVYNSVNNQ